jgi:GH15 family glucan-1,4-alpha-glucosidase
MSGREKKAAVLAIEQHGAIGNLQTVLLAGCDGAIAWCCLPELDSPSVFASLLDARRGGRFRIAPAAGGLGRQRYLEDSNVLETQFELPGACLSVVDFMPLTARGGRLRPGPPAIHRIVTAHGGPVRVKLEWSPRFDYARGPTGIGATGAGWIAAGSAGRASLTGVPAQATATLRTTGGSQTLRASFTLLAGTSAALVMRWDDAGTQAGAGDSAAALRTTLRAWRRWSARGHRTGWAGPHAALVQRSVLALKLFCHGESGAIAAAATTSLPEAIGGERNWDYRYTWLRDAGMTIEALLGSGHADEVQAFLDFGARAGSRPNPHGPWLQLLFGLRGETELPLVTLPHLAGYRGSRPVRIGNSIARHRGHDIYEQFLGAALEYAALGYRLKPAVRDFLTRAADIAAADWRQPDNGIWEIPGGPRHYVHSKWTVSTALDYALRLAREHGLRGDTGRWAAERDACRSQVLERGYDRRRRCFRMAYDIDALDAANVLMPVQGFLPADDPRVAANLRRTMRELVVDDLCYRYRLDDGLRGEEGCFVPCTFWITEALVMAGQVRRARKLFDRAAARASPLGLWSEQIDPDGGHFLGNFPQAFSHVAFHDAALRLAAAEGKAVPAPVDPAQVAAAPAGTAIAKRKPQPAAARRGGRPAAGSPGGRR